MNLMAFFTIDIVILVILFLLYKRYKTQPSISIKAREILMHGIYKRGTVAVTKNIEMHYNLYIENNSSQINTIKHVEIYFEDAEKKFEENINLSTESYRITPLTLNNVCFSLPDYPLKKQYKTEIKVADQYDKSYSRDFYIKVPQKYLSRKDQ